MNELICSVCKTMSDGFDKATISNPARKSMEVKKLTIERRGEKYIATFFHEVKATHRNFSDISEVVSFLSEETIGQYKQIDIIKNGENTRILVNKRGNFRIGHETLPPVSLPKISNVHDNEKNHILKENEPVGFLVLLGITNASGQLKKEYRKKFAQINSFLDIVKDIVKYIDDGAKIVDFGCGKSYLTFALYYYLNVLSNKNVQIVGIDLKKDVIEFCAETAKELGYVGLEFICADISKSDVVEKADMVVALHACDTASDFALYKAIDWNARIILCAPCCQHELYNQIKNNNLNLIIKHGILKERLSAIVTDAFRASLLKDMGYSVSLIEFIDSQHTPKNLMIKAVKMFSGLDDISDETRAFIDFFEVSPMLYKLCKKDR